MGNFKELIKILKQLVDQYQNNPYYNLYKSINNIYNFCLSMEKSETVGIDTDSKIKKNIRYKREFKELKNDDKIISINIIRNNFNNLDLLKIYCNKTNFETLEILRLQENNISDIKVLSELELPKLKELNLSKNRLDDNCIEHLKNLKNKKTIKILNIYDNNIKNPEFFTIIKDFIKLEQLFVGGNKFEDKFNEKIYDFPDSLVTIGLTIGVFNNKSIKAIGKFNFKKLKTLYLKGDGLENLDFINDLKCEALENIWLRNNFITDYKPLEKLKESLKKIVLRGNLISNIKGLKEFVENFKNLNELDISDNKIDLNNIENSDIIDKVIKLKKVILKYT